ncbi:hypothetical protein GCM10009086_58340 [Pseudomonas rhodesiae]
MPMLGLFQPTTKLQTFLSSTFRDRCICYPAVPVFEVHRNPGRMSRECAPNL